MFDSKRSCDTFPGAKRPRSIRTCRHALLSPRDRFLVTRGPDRRALARMDIHGPGAFLKTADT